MMADTVPAVQALGQCIFLPMLIIGGVAVPLASLPDWAQRLSAFFPGRYAVQALQACVTGDGLGAAGFSMFALLLIGGAGCLAGAMLFRWDAQQRFADVAGQGAGSASRSRHGSPSASLPTPAVRGGECPALCGTVSPSRLQTPVGRHPVAPTPAAPQHKPLRLKPRQRHRRRATPTPAPTATARPIGRS